MRAIRPDVPILLSSGYSSHEVGDRADLEDADGFFRKPYRIAELRAALDGARGSLVRASDPNESGEDE